MRRIVLDTNCLLMSLPKNSPYRILWDAFLSGAFILCVSNEILEEYVEILSRKTSASVAGNVISTILNQSNIEQIVPYYRFGLIQSDADDNKFVDCAISAGAEYLVSNDNHFQILHKIPFPKVNIVTLNFFVRVLKGYGLSNNQNELLLNEP